MPEVAEFGACHEDEFGVGGEGREDLAREAPLVVLEEMVALGGGHLGVLGIGCALDEGVRRGDFQAQRELGTAARVDGVVDAGARQLEVEGEVVAGAVGDDEVGPVLHHVHLVTEFAVEGEVVVGPTETLAVAYADAESAEILALVRLHFAVVVVVIAAAVVTVVVVVVVVVEAVVALEETVGIARLRSEENAGTQRVRSLAAKPRFQETDGGGGVVDTIGAGVDGEGLPLALRHNAITLGVEEVLDGEIGELESQRADETSGTPAERELDLVGGFGLELVGDVHGAVLGIGLNIRD